MNELDKLEAYLKENGIEYTREDRESKERLYDNKHQIVVYKDGVQQWDVICHPGSYGYEEGLLEIYGNIVDYEKDGDSVAGWLTADDIIQRIQK